MWPLLFLVTSHGHWPAIWPVQSALITTSNLPQLWTQCQLEQHRDQYGPWTGWVWQFWSGWWCCAQQITRKQMISNKRLTLSMPRSKQNVALCPISSLSKLPALRPQQIQNWYFNHQEPFTKKTNNHWQLTKKIRDFPLSVGNGSGLPSWDPGCNQTARPGLGQQPPRTQTV